MKNTLEKYDIVVSFSTEESSMISGDLVTEVSTNREVKVCRGSLKGGYSTSFDAESDFVLSF